MTTSTILTVVDKVAILTLTILYGTVKDATVGLASKNQLTDLINRKMN